MFSTDALKVPDSPTATPLPGGIDVDMLEIGELLELRSAIQARLPMTLQEIDLENELALNYQEAKSLITKTMAGDAAANQKAQVLNSCSAILQQIGKLQIQLYNTERLKAIEQALIRAVRTLPEDAQRLFFDDYEKLYNSTSNEGMHDGKENSQAVAG